MSYAYYLVDVIAPCESLIGPAIADHLANSGLLEPRVSQADAVERAKRDIVESHVMPQWAKDMGLLQLAHVDYVEMQRVQSSKLLNLLRANALAPGDEV